MAPGKPGSGRGQRRAAPATYRAGRAKRPCFAPSDISSSRAGLRRREGRKTAGRADNQEGGREDCLQEVVVCWPLASLLFPAFAGFSSRILIAKIELGVGWNNAGWSWRGSLRRSGRPGISTGRRRVAGSVTCRVAGVRIGRWWRLRFGGQRGALGQRQHAEENQVERPGAAPAHEVHLV